jgi:L-lactate permease
LCCSVFFAAFALIAVLFAFFVCAALPFCSACCFFTFFCCLWKFENKRGFERGSQEIKVKSSANQHSCKRIFCSAFAALLAIRLLVFFESTWNSNKIKRNQRGNQVEINVEFQSGN